MAYNEKTQATGLYQITPVCLADFRQNHDLEVPKWHRINRLTMQDMFDSYFNWLVASWYLERRIPEIFKAYRIEDTVENRLIAYSWGISNLRKYLKDEKKLPKSVKSYLRKYKEK